MAEEKSPRQKQIDANKAKLKLKKGGNPWTGASGQYAWRSPTSFTPQDLGMIPPTFEVEPPDDGAGTGTGAGLSALDRYTRAIQNMLTSGSYRKPQDDLLARLQTMYGQAQPQINTAMDNLAGFLQGQTNPYAGLQAQTTQATPALSELLKSQGVDQTPLQQLAAVTQAQNTGQSTAFQNLIGSMQNMWQGNQAGQLADVNTQRADLQTQLENARLGAGAQLETKSAGQQQDLMTMLLSALAQGGRAKKGRLV